MAYYAFHVLFPISRIYFLCGFIISEHFAEMNLYNMWSFVSSFSRHVFRGHRVVACVSTWFFHVDEEHSTIGTDQIFYIHSSVDGHVYSCHSVVMLNYAAMNICVQLFLYGHMFLYLLDRSRSGSAILYDLHLSHVMSSKFTFNVLRNCRTVFQSAALFPIPKSRGRKFQFLDLVDRAFTAMLLGGRWCLTVDLICIQLMT